jgi:putative (di)nucleoside polyphosphate hydrolase
MRFTGEEQEIDIKTKIPEFLEWKWIELDQITEVVVDFKLQVYKELKEKVKRLLIKRS